MLNKLFERYGIDEQTDLLSHLMHLFKRHK